MKNDYTNVIYTAPSMEWVAVHVEHGFAVSEFGDEGDAGAPLDNIDNGIF